MQPLWRNCGLLAQWSAGSSTANRRRQKTVTGAAGTAGWKAACFLCPPRGHAFCLSTVVIILNTFSAQNATFPSAMAYGSGRTLSHRFQQDINYGNSAFSSVVRQMPGTARILPNWAKTFTWLVHLLFYGITKRCDNVQ